MLNILKNKVIVFIATRYFSYFLQFLNSLIIAFTLGPYYLGIWGFLNLILQYLAFGNFGIENAMNVTLATGDIVDEKKQSALVSNSLIATFFSSLFLMITGLIIYLFNFHLFEKFLFSQYMIFIIVIACLNYFNLLFVNLFRIYSQFTPISIFQLIIQLFQLPICFLLSNDSSQIASGLLLAMALAHVISFLFFVIKLPLKVSIKFDFKTIKNLYERGLLLLFYNITFYLLMLSTRSLVGLCYPVDTLGLFTFASSIATALIVGLSSLEFIVFPKMLNRLSADVISVRSIFTFREVRSIYMSTVFLIALLGLGGYSMLLYYFDKYADTVEVFTLLIVCQIVMSAGFGYSTLIIARKKELFLALHGLVALVINIVISLIGFKVFEFGYSFMAFSLILSFIYYNAQIIRKGRELLQLKPMVYNVIVELFPVKFLIPLICILFSLLTNQHQLVYILSLFLFVSFNFKELALAKKYIMVLLSKPSMVNI